MWKIQALLCAISVVGSAVAQEATSVGAQGINDDGFCVRPCSRMGGRPCRPCLPRVGPGSPEWDDAVAETARDNESFAEKIKDIAKVDREYRESPDYKLDRKAYRDVERAVKHMNKIGD